MDKRINRCVELLEQDQAIYYDGPHSGHVLTHAQGRIDAGTWADYMNVAWSMVRSTWLASPSTCAAWSMQGQRGRGIVPRR